MPVIDHSLFMLSFLLKSSGDQYFGRLWFALSVMHENVAVLVVHKASLLSSSIRKETITASEIVVCFTATSN